MNGLLLGICVVVFSLTAMAAEKGLVTKPSQYSVPETLDRWRPSSDRWAFTSLLGSISRLWQEMLAMRCGRTSCSFGSVANFHFRAVL